MSTLYLIRHGQASWGAAEYDVLSDLGATQARLLGGWLAARGQRLDAVYAGPLRRQVDTARHLVETAGLPGQACPEAEILPELAEHPTEAILAAALPALLEDDRSLAAALAAEAPDGNAWSSGRPFALAFERAMLRWTRGEVSADGLEPFSAFSARIERGLRRIVAAQGRGKTVVAITSGGTIAFLLRHLLALGEPMALRLNLVIANTSITELRWRGDEVTLFSFNATPHLERPELVTTR